MVSSVQPYNATHLNILFNRQFPNCAQGEGGKVTVEDEGAELPEEDVSFSPEAGRVVVRVEPCEDHTLTLTLVLGERRNASSEPRSLGVRYSHDCSSQQPSSPGMWVLVVLVAALMAALLVVAYIKRPTEIEWTPEAEEAKVKRRKASDPVHTTQNPYAGVEDQFKDGWREDHLEIRPERLETYIKGPDPPPAQYVEDRRVMLC